MCVISYSFAILGLPPSQQLFSLFQAAARLVFISPVLSVAQPTTSRWWRDHTFPFITAIGAIMVASGVFGGKNTHDVLYPAVQRVADLDDNIKTDDFILPHLGYRTPGDARFFSQFRLVHFHVNQLFPKRIVRYCSQYAPPENIIRDECSSCQSKCLRHHSGRRRNRSYERLSFMMRFPRLFSLLPYHIPALKQEIP